MRLLARCPQCKEFHVKEMGGTRETFERLLETVPRALDYVVCDWCMSMMRTNHLEMFFEPFTTITEMGVLGWMDNV